VGVERLQADSGFGDNHVDPYSLHPARIEQPLGGVQVL
jgi:hypothetical protein